ncbi:hypothetical protein [Agromyces albus]|uniref:hypothetical protein n=1 Tax=Agromyces albus TaxID=205332 RepID=UPI00277EAA03|nr:hypothetical protein [Agromyces albus]MDQ0577037.1 hypothetical protein [Agromyces albus]
MSEIAASPVIDGVEWVRPRPDRLGLRRDLVVALVLAAGTAGRVVLYRATGFGEGAPWWGSALWVWNLIFYSAVQDYLPELSRGGDGPLSPYLAYGLINVITNLLSFGACSAVWWRG